MNKEEQVMNGFRELYNKLVWLNKDKMEEGLKGFKSSEVHCIEYIENNADSNVTQLAEAFYVTRGAISRMTKKLIQKALLKATKSQKIRKEIYFRLTEQGKEIYKIHENLHKEFQERDKAVFEQVTEEEFNSIISFVEKYSRHLDAEIKKQGIHIKS